jgi:hypothetical protein
MSYDEFVENGTNLKKLHLFVMNLERDNTKSSKKTQRVIKATKLILKLKDVLDDILYDSFPDKEGQELSHVLYGESEEEMK